MFAQFPRGKIGLEHAKAEYPTGGTVPSFPPQFAAPREARSFRAAVTLLLNPNRIGGLAGHQQIMQRALLSSHYSPSFEQILSPRSTEQIATRATGAKNIRGVSMLTFPAQPSQFARWWFRFFAKGAAHLRQTKHAALVGLLVPVAVLLVIVTGSGQQLTSVPNRTFFPNPRGVS
jgi:hypothetical protein